MIGRFVVVSVIVLVGGFCAGNDRKADKKNDKDQLQGEWVVVSIENSGKKVDSKDRKLVVKQDEWTAPGGGKFKFKIDATKDPKQLDLTREIDGKDSTWVGIYKIEGDTVTFCRSTSPRGDRRPTEFKAGQGVFLMVCKRAGK
jgi:uncharacterized protein (TIGR03067 family)